MSAHSQTVRLHGDSISPGWGEGNIFIHKGLATAEDLPTKIGRFDVDEECARLDVATAKTSIDLTQLAARVTKEIDARLAEVFDAHRSILNDQSLRDELRSEIVDNLINASSAVKNVFFRWENKFLLMESQFAQGKGDDMRDISIRLRNAIAGINIHPLENIPLDCVLVTRRLLPSDTVFLANRSVAAVLLEYGSAGSHAALFSRQMGLPCIAGLEGAVRSMRSGDRALVDAENGTVVVNPTAADETKYRGDVDHYRSDFLQARKHARSAAVTRSGVVIRVQANVGSQKDTSVAIANGADGIGLYRLEQSYIGRATPPSRTELNQEMRHVLRGAEGRSVCIRLLDAGSDKPLPFLGFSAESNPALGRRGIRLLREYPELLLTQLEAILDLQDDFKIQILVPMVTVPSDVVCVRNALRELCDRQPGFRMPELGAMIETPAAAFSSREIAKYVDFMSFGSNDLAQYAFAADRESGSIDRYFKDASHVIFRMMLMVHTDAPEVPLSICGELAGRKEYIADLLKCGIKTLSVAPPLIASIKATVRDQE